MTIHDRRPLAEDTSIDAERVPISGFCTAALANACSSLRPCRTGALLHRLFVIVTLAAVANVVPWQSDVPDVPRLGVTVIAAKAPGQGPSTADASDLAAPPDVAAPPADAERLPSGLASRLVTPGSSPERPTPTDVVTVHYSGWTVDGMLFESSRHRGTPTMFPLNRSLPGWRECVPLMTVGETRRCWVPEALAYRGQAGRPKGTVVFDIQLLDTRRAPNVPPPDVKEPPADARRTPSGVLYQVLKPGSGTRKPQPWSRVTVHYTGWTTAGQMVDSSVARGQPTVMQLDQVIRGWTEGLQLMVEGERMRFWIPENLAYKGEAGSPRGMLVFDIDLIEIHR